MKFKEQILIVASVIGLSLPFGAEADGESADSAAAAAPDTQQIDADDSKSAASFDKRLPPFVPGENHPDGGKEMKVWTTVGPVPVNKAPEPFKKYDARDLVQGGVSVIIDERENTKHGKNEKAANSDTEALDRDESR